MDITAVDWLVNKVYMVIPDSERNFLEGLKEMAKEMEKEQIINAMEKTAMYVSAALIDKEIGKMTFEDLYNQTYNQNK